MGVIYLHKVAYGKGSGGSGGTTDYNELSNKPKINNTTLIGNIDSEDLNLISGDDAITDEQIDELISILG